MIPLRELRIGNLVQKDGRLHVVQENDFLQVNNFEHVDITRDNLVLLGFNCIATDEICSVHTHYILEGYFNLKYRILSTPDYRKGRHAELAGVHMLQGLYFYCTGTELDISSLLKARQ